LAAEGFYQAAGITVQDNIQKRTKGVDNNAADALSRQPHEADLFALSTTSSTWMQDVVDGYQTDEEALKLLTTLAISEHPPFSLHNGVIKYGNRVWLGTNVPLQTKVTACRRFGPGGSLDRRVNLSLRAPAQMGWREMEHKRETRLILSRTRGVCS
jgi:hypothetical protein